MAAKRFKPLRIIALMHADLVPPDSLDGYTDKQIQEWKCEFDVTQTLREMGHVVEKVGVIDDLGAIRSAIASVQPDITFNLLEEFHQVSIYDQHVASYLELIKQPYTGCNPRGLLLARDKALSKQIMMFHRIATPRFMVIPRGRKYRIPKRLAFPLLVKSTTEDASFGLSRSSVVHDESSLREQIAHCHAKIGTDALVEEYIEGREFYVGVLGNERLKVLPIWELSFKKLPQGVPNIATAQVKWDHKYQEKVGVETGRTTDLSPAVESSIQRLCKRVYRALCLSGYARIDLRMKDNGEIFVLEANPNPNLSFGEDFAESAAAVGIGYEGLLQRILKLGLSYSPAWRS
jgi:D-alanine-D-alanine ligase